MESLRRMVCRGYSLPAGVLEVAGGLLVSAGLYQVYVPAALVFAGAALVFIAQGLERDR